MNDTRYQVVPTTPLINTSTQNISFGNVPNYETFLNELIGSSQQVYDTFFNSSLHVSFENRPSFLREFFNTLQNNALNQTILDNTDYNVGAVDSNIINASTDSQLHSLVQLSSIPLNSNCLPEPSNDLIFRDGIQLDDSIYHLGNMNAPQLNILDSNNVDDKHINCVTTDETIASQASILPVKPFNSYDANKAETASLALTANMPTDNLNETVKSNTEESADRVKSYLPIQTGNLDATNISHNIVFFSQDIGNPLYHSTPIFKEIEISTESEVSFNVLNISPNICRQPTSNVKPNTVNEQLLNQSNIHNNISLDIFKTPITHSFSFSKPNSKDMHLVEKTDNDYKKLEIKNYQSFLLSQSKKDKEPSLIIAKNNVAGNSNNYKMTIKRPRDTVNDLDEILCDIQLDHHNKNVNNMIYKPIKNSDSIIYIDNEDVNNKFNTLHFNESDLIDLEPINDKNESASNEKKLNQSIINNKNFHNETETLNKLFFQYPIGVPLYSSTPKIRSNRANNNLKINNTTSNSFNNCSLNGIQKIDIFKHKKVKFVNNNVLKLSGKVDKKSVNKGTGTILDIIDDEGSDLIDLTESNNLSENIEPIDKTTNIKLKFSQLNSEKSFQKCNCNKEIKDKYILANNVRSILDDISDDECLEI